MGIIKTIFPSVLFILSVLTVHAQKADSLLFRENGVRTLIDKNENDSLSQNGSVLEQEIGQLIIDDTFSKAGNDFQQLFNTRWVWPAQNAEQFIITLTEKPSFVNSTLIEISINDLKVFESFLQPRYDILEETVAQAIEVTAQHILNYEEVLKQLNGEDLTGSGIY